MLLTCVKMSQTLCQGKLAVQLDVGDLVLLRLFPSGTRQTTSHRRRSAPRSRPRRDRRRTAPPMPSRASTPRSPEPSSGGPNRLVPRPRGEHVVVLSPGVGEEIQASTGPVVAESPVVGHLHEALDLDEVEVPVRRLGAHVRCDERVVHGGEALLSVKDDVLGIVPIALVAIDRLTHERAEDAPPCHAREGDCRCSSRGRWTA